MMMMMMSTPRVGIPVYFLLLFLGGGPHFFLRHLGTAIQLKNDLGAQNMGVLFTHPPNCGPLFLGLLPLASRLLHKTKKLHRDPKYRCATPTFWTRGALRGAISTHPNFGPRALSITAMYKPGLAGHYIITSVKPDRASPPTSHK
jgi:hypothetical protein